MTFIYPNKPRRIFNAATIPTIAASIDFDNWIVQPKWNGHRALPYCDGQGKITVYNRFAKPLALAASNWNWLSMLEIPRPWLLDGELLRDGRMIVWDYAILDGQTKIQIPYRERLTELEKLISKKISKERYSIDIIETLPALKYKNFMLRAGEPELEGFVLKNSTALDLWGIYKTSEVGSQFKYRF